MFSFVKKYKKGLFLGTLLITTAAIPLTVSLSKKSQDIRQHAQQASPSSDTVTIKGHYVDNEGKDLFLNGQEVRLYLSNDETNTIGSFVSSSLSSPTWTFANLPRNNYRVVARGGYTDYTLSYSICQDCTSHTTYVDSGGDIHSINFLTNPQSKYVDVYFKYSKEGTSTPSPTSIITPTISPTTTPQASKPTTVSITIKLHGLGDAGDSATGTGGNTKPAHTRRYINIHFYKPDGTFVTSAGDTIDYDEATLSFKGKITLPKDLAVGAYKVSFSSPGYLEKYITSAFTINQEENNILPVTTLPAGNINNDKTLDLLDYNILMDCWLQKAGCTMELKAASDLDDNGTVDAVDYNLLFREITTTPRQI